jgi:hypothetical protein
LKNKLEINKKNNKKKRDLEATLNPEIFQDKVK